MLKTELLELITNGENSGIEFKRDDIRPEQLAKEIVALANFQGGRVLLGVDDDGTVTGIQRDKLEEWVMNVIQDKVHPLILPFYEEIRLDDSKKVAVITFPQGISKPYVVRDKGEEKIYIRVGSTSRQATREQQMRLFELGGLLHTEVMPVPQTDLCCLDEARLVTITATSSKTLKFQAAPPNGKPGYWAWVFWRRRAIKLTARLRACCCSGKARAVI